MKKKNKSKLGADMAYLISRRVERERRLSEIEERLPGFVVQLCFLENQKSLSEDEENKLGRLRTWCAQLSKERDELKALLIEPWKQRIRVKM